MATLASMRWCHFMKAWELMTHSASEASKASRILCGLKETLISEKSVQSFVEQLSELDQIVRKLVLESLGLEKYIDEHIESTNYLVRVQKYDFPESHEIEVGLTAHTDKNMVTILYQNEVNGLEVQTKDGQWIIVEPSADSFVVMIRQAFHVSASTPSDALKAYCGA